MGILDLIDCLQPFRSDDRDLRTDGRDHQDIPRHEMDIGLLVTLGDEIVQVQIGDNRAVAFQLDMTHGTRRIGSARGKQCVNQGRKAGQGVGARPSCMADNVNLHGTKLPHGDVEVEIAEHPADPALEEGLDVTSPGYR